MATSLDETAIHVLSPKGEREKRELAVSILAAWIQSTGEIPDLELVLKTAEEFQKALDKPKPQPEG